MPEPAARYLVGRNRSDRARFRALLGSLAIVALAGAVSASCSSNSSSSSTTSSSSTSTTSAARSTAAVSGLQMALASVGCYSGPVDGISGPATTRALRAFQAASGLTVDGTYGLQTKSKLMAAVSAGTRVCTTTSTTTTSTTPPGSGVPTTATAAISSYEDTNGPPAGTWMISASQVSSVDPTYVLFHIGPTAGNENTVQGGYGFAHSANGRWSVIGFGSAEVGCPPGSAQNQLVPAAVLAAFGLACPPS